MHPFIGLGLALQRQGAQVVIASASEYRSKVEHAGLAFAAVRPSFADIERDLGMSRAQIIERCVAHHEFLFRKVVCPYLQASFDDMLALTADADLLLTSSLAFGARLAAEKRALPWIGIALQPFMFLSAFDPPVIPQSALLSALLRNLNPRGLALLLSGLKTLFAPLLRPVHRLRAQAGLAPTRLNPLFEGQFSTLGAIGLYSPLLGQVQPDYPQPTILAGFSWFDSDEGPARDLDPSLRDFLDTGSAPLVFTLGSLIVHSPGDFYLHSAAAAHSLRRRAVLLVGEAQLEGCARLASKEIFVAAYAPHSQVFARAAAIIHHGGVGTLAQALRAGRPQLMVPFFADQLDNAARAQRLGVSMMVAPRKYRAQSAETLLVRLLSDPAIAARAARVGEQIVAEDGAANAARFILRSAVGPATDAGV